MGQVGGRERVLPCGEQPRRLSEVDDCGREQSQAPMVMFVVVPGEERAAEAKAVLLGIETVGELRPVLERFEVALRERIVVGDMRPAVRLGDAQRGQQLSDALGAHRRSAVGVDRQLLGVETLFVAALADQPPGQVGAFASGQQPAHHIAAEYVEHHVQVEVRPFGRAQQLGNVPGPDLVGRGGQQLGFLVARMPQLIAPLANFLGLMQDAVHRADRAEVRVFVEQGGVNLGRRAIDEPLAVQRVEHRLPLRGTQRARWRGPHLGRGRCGAGLLPPIVRSAGHPQRRAARRQGEIHRELLGGHHQAFSPLSGLFREMPRISETFF